MYWFYFGKFVVGRYRQTIIEGFERWECERMRILYGVINDVFNLMK